MAAHEDGLKVLSFAYKDMSMSDLDSLMKTHNPESNEFRESLESNLTYLCTFALEDPLRVDIKDTCQMIKYGHRVEDE